MRIVFLPARKVPMVGEIKFMKLFSPKIWQLFGTDLMVLFSYRAFVLILYYVFGGIGKIWSRKTNKLAWDSCLFSENDLGQCGHCWAGTWWTTSRCCSSKLFLTQRRNFPHSLVHNHMPCCGSQYWILLHGWNGKKSVLRIRINVTRIRLLDFANSDPEPLVNLKLEPHLYIYIYFFLASGGGSPL